MLIRKQFKFEGAHIVRNCSTNRCKKSIHGHSYIVEVFFESNTLDNGHMVLDFGLTKKHIKNIIDSFDHTYTIWEGESQEFKDFFMKNSQRYVQLPMSPSAEVYSLMFLKLLDFVFSNMQLKNAEGKVELTSVRVHETKTGYAQAFRTDLDMIEFDLSKIIFSDGVMEEWNDKEELKKILSLIKKNYQ